MEKFCCRFKTVEVANNFHEAFMKAKAIAKAKEESGAGSEQVCVSGLTRGGWAEGDKKNLSSEIR